RRAGAAGERRGGCHDCRGDGYGCRGVGCDSGGGGVSVVDGVSGGDDVSGGAVEYCETRDTNGTHRHLSAVAAAFGYLQPKCAMVAQGQSSAPGSDVKSVSTRGSDVTFPGLPFSSA